MKARTYPKIFSTPMVIRLLADEKLQTRRLIKESNSECTAFLKDLDFNDVVVDGDGTYLKVARHSDDTRHRVFSKVQVGDILYVREAFYAFGKWIKDGTTKTGKQQWRFVDLTIKRGAKYGYVAGRKPDTMAVRTDKGVGEHWYKRNSLFMPKSAARIFLKVTKVRVERACDISGHDCMQEGILGGTDDLCCYNYERKAYDAFDTYESFQSLWNAINGAETWENYVWVYNFERIKKP